MIIAIDVGGTKISAALIADDVIIEQRKIPSVIHHDLSELSHYLIHLCQDWVAQATAVAVACTGQVGDKNVNFLSAKQKLPLKSQLEAGFSLPVTIINDAAAAAWAEYHAMTSSAKEGARTVKSHDDIEFDDTLVYITVSTGIGGGMIQNGHLVTSADGFCAHLGHVSVQHANQQSVQCHCGRINCVEAIASGTAIAKQASLILAKNVSCQEAFEHHLAVSEISTLIDHATSAVCDLIANIKAVTGTKQVVLGGSVGSSTVFYQQVVAKVADLPEIYQVNISPPKMGADADLIGAMLYSKSN